MSARDRESMSIAPVSVLVLAIAVSASPGCTCNGSAKSASKSIPVTAWPKSDHLFCVDLDGDGIELVAGADGNDLWIAEPAEGGVRVRYRGSGAAPVERVAAGDYGHGSRLYVARGHDKTTPLTLDEIEIATGKSMELFHRDLERPEAVMLAVIDVDRDKKPDLAFAYYATKTTVRTHHFKADGGIIEGPPERTAEARIFVDLDGDGVNDAVVGQLYGDGAGPVAGNLRVDLGKGPISVKVEGGVRAVAAGKDDKGQAVLYFADGWAANYIKEAHATLKRARWNGTGFDVELVGASSEEFTIYSLAAGGDERGFLIVASGNQRPTLFEGPWRVGSGELAAKVVATPLDAPGKGVVAACRTEGGRLRAFAPGDPTRELALSKPR